MSDRYEMANGRRMETGGGEKPRQESRTLVRWVRFNLVGQLGFVLQLVTIHLLHNRLGLHYLSATALAVEAAVLHNFLWHRAWTWGGRGLDRPLRRLVHFHLGSGGVSLAGNLAGMTLLVGHLGMSVVPANLCTIAACAVVNFWLSDRFIFASSSKRDLNSGTARSDGPCRTDLGFGVPEPKARSVTNSNTVTWESVDWKETVGVQVLWERPQRCKGR